MILTTKVLSKTDSVIAGVAKCPYCSTSFQVGDHVVFCPSDSTPHHVKCWQANGNRCSTLGCTGEGRARSSLIIAALPSEFRAVQGGIMTKAFEAFGIPDLSKSGGNGALVVYAPPEKEGCTVIICQVNYDMTNNKPVYAGQPNFASVLEYELEGNRTIYAAVFPLIPAVNYEVRAPVEKIGDTADKKLITVFAQRVAEVIFK